MGLLSFLKDAGEKLFHTDKAAGQPPAATKTLPDAPANNARTLEQAEEQAILHYISTQNLSADNLRVQFDSATATVTVTGTAPDQATHEKIILCCGNVQGVAHVNDQMKVMESEAVESQWYTVARGDTLSKISKEFYGDANKYMRIFEANKPMLASPDKIYPGQMLRIPMGA